MEQEAKLAEILVEAEFLDKRQLAENQATKARSDMHAAMQDAFFKNEVATNEEFKRPQAGSNRKIALDVHQQILKQQNGQTSNKRAICESNALKSRTIKSTLKEVM